MSILEHGSVAPLFYREKSDINARQVASFVNLTNIQIKAEPYDACHQYQDAPIIFISHPVCHKQISDLVKLPGKVVLIDGPRNEKIEFWHLNKGIDGYLYKNQDRDELELALQSVSVGELWYQRKVMTKYIKVRGNETKRDTVKDNEKIKNLSRREIDVYLCLLQGSSNQQIADNLYISIPTVKTHVSNILRKTNTNSRIDLIDFELASANTSQSEPPVS